MSARTALQAFLKSQQIAGLEDNVYQGYAPELAAGTWAVLDTISGGFFSAGTDGCDLATSAIQVRIWGASYPQVATVTDLIRRAVQGFSGLWDTLQVWEVSILDAEEDEVEEPVANQEPRLYVERLNLLVHHVVTEPDNA